MPSAPDIATAPPQPLVTMPAADGVPRWIRGGTVYGMIVSRVGNGTFQDVAARLDDLADLGVAALWLAPITPTLPGHFGYEVLEYQDVRPEYGSRDDFRDLVKQAHARGIRVLLDVVPNHTSIAHPWYVESDAGGPGHPRYAWYDRDAEGHATHYFDWRHLPNLNVALPEVREAITEALLNWVRETDIDGFRVDVAWGIRQRCPDFWAPFTEAFRALKPDGLLIAEASAHDPYYLANGFDLAYDWTPDLGHWAWTDVFEGDRSVPDALRNAMSAAIDGDYNPVAHTFRFLNNNDTGARFIDRHGVGLYRTALAALLTLPGVPCLYLGDEVGASFEPYGPAGPIGTDNQHGLRPFVRSLVALRRRLLDAGSPSWSWIATEPAESVSAWSITGAIEPALVVINWSDRSSTVRLRDFDHVFAQRARLTDAISGEHIDITGGTIELDAWGMAVLAEAGRER